jgi:hypothetical protein
VEIIRVVQGRVEVKLMTVVLVIGTDQNKTIPRKAHPMTTQIMSSHNFLPLLPALLLRKNLQ